MVSDLPVFESWEIIFFGVVDSPALLCKQNYVYHRIPLYLYRTYFADFGLSFRGGILVSLIFIAIALLLSWKPLEAPFKWLAKIKLPLAAKQEISGKP